MNTLALDLQLFADDAGETAESSGGDVTGAEIQQAPGGDGGQQTATFQDLIAGQYKQEYEAAVGQRVNSAIQARFKNQRNLQQQLDGVAPIMRELAAKYGVDAQDVKGIYAKMTDDLSLYQKEADELGTSPEIVRNMHRLQAENQRVQAENQRFTQEAQMQQHFRTLSEQAEQMKQQFPGFDLMAEMQNPRFARMTSPQGGMDVKTAFYAVHGEEIARNGMQYAARQAAGNVAASVRSGASRPVENGMQRQAPVSMGVDIAHMDKKTRAEYRRRIANGELINFTDKI